ncbi:ribonuclease P protein component [bacterium]|nr:ribonuclease P protein component [bacterium]|tara:strand:+ start:2851 stop:3222 length:372 start_codon:yes stop_codon:yes gene_type:complete
MSLSLVARKKIKINIKSAILNGNRLNAVGLTIYIQNKKTKSSNLSVIISKKVSNLAVVRNKYKRILKEIYRLDFKLVEYNDIVFVVNKKILDLDFNRIRKELSKVRKQMVNEKLTSENINTDN